VTPSRVSQTLRSFESRIGGRLFDRTSRTVRLTPLGERGVTWSSAAAGLIVWCHPKTALRDSTPSAKVDNRAGDDR
jgi:hypothetical protein